MVVVLGKDDDAVSSCVPDTPKKFNHVTFPIDDHDTLRRCVSGRIYDRIVGSTVVVITVLERDVGQPFDIGITRRAGQHSWRCDWRKRSRTRDGLRARRATESDGGIGDDTCILIVACPDHRRIVPDCGSAQSSEHILCSRLNSLLARLVGILIGLVAVRLGISLPLLRGRGRLLRHLELPSSGGLGCYGHVPRVLGLFLLGQGRVPRVLSFPLPPFGCRLRIESVLLRHLSPVALGLGVPLRRLRGVPCFLGGALISSGLGQRGIGRSLRI